MKTPHAAIAAIGLLPILGAANQSAANLAATHLAATHLAAANPDSPGARVHKDGAVTMVYGAPMVAEAGQAAGHAAGPVAGESATAREAADAWLAAGALAQDASFRIVREIPLRDRTILHYEQVAPQGDLPVDGSLVRVMVMHEPFRVVFGSGRLAPTAAQPAGQPGAQPSRGAELAATVDPQSALETVRAMPAFAGLTSYTRPTLVAFAGEELDRPLRTAWKFSGSAPDEQGEAYAFYVDARTGALIHHRDIIFHCNHAHTQGHTHTHPSAENPVDVTGTVDAFATPGTLAPSAANPPVLVPIDQLQVSIGATTALTDPTGAFSIPHPGATPVTVDADLISPWVRVNNNAGVTESHSRTVTPPGPADFTFNPSRTEFGVAQINALIHVNRTHDYFTSRAPGFTAIDEQITANVNFASSCNAFYNPMSKSVNMFRAGLWQGIFCENTSFSAILAHEYGHFVHTELGIVDNAFGEGYSDSISHLLYDVQEIGAGVTTFPGFSRDPIAANIQWPCSSGIPHTCGQMLSGAWYRTRLNLGNVHGSQAGLELARRLHVEWTLVTIGASGGQAAGPGTAIEVLMVDDNDGNLANGTPNYESICAAFSAHNIDCPAVTVCYADCDQSTGAGVLDIFDFLCFQDAFATGDPYADCTGNAVLDIFDFLCFQDAFAAGCP